MGTFKYLVDLDGDGFINKWAKRTDTLQSLATWLDPLDYDTWSLDVTDNTDTTVDVVTSADGGTTPPDQRNFGTHHLRTIVTSADTEGVEIFTDGIGGFDISTTSGKTYTVVFWIWSTTATEPPDDLNYRARLYSLGHLNLEATVTGTATAATWTQVSISYTAGASNNLLLQVAKTNATARTFYISGVMVFESVGAITVPAGYNKGNASNIYDDITEDVKNANWQLGMWRPYQQMADEGTANLTLDNSTALYTPENSASALYGLLKPTMLFEIGHWLGGAMSNYRVMYRGQLDTPPIRITYETAGAQSGKTNVNLAAISNKLWLDVQDFEKAMTTNNIGLIIRDILGNTSFAGAYGFNYVGLTGARAGTVTNYAPQPDSTAWQAIQELVAVEEGKFYLDRGGTVNLLGQYYSYDGGSVPYSWSGHGQGTAASSIAGTIAETGSYKPYQRLDYAYGANYINRVRVTAHPRTTSASGTVWSGTSLDYDIPPGTTDYMIVRLRDSQGRFTSVASPTISLLTYSSGTATTTVTAQGGKARIDFNNVGAVSAVLSSLALTGAGATQSHDIAIEVGSAGTATYGVRMLSYDLSASGSARQVRQIARHILNRDNVFQGYVYSVPFKNKGDGTANTHQLAWEIGTKVRVDIDSLSHDRDYWIIGEKHEILQDGISHKTTFALEPTSTTSFWLAGVEGFSNAGVSTRAG